MSTELLLESWDRQVRILDNLFSQVTEELKHARPDPDGMPIFEQFAHIHNTRRYWLNNVSPKHIEGYGRSYVEKGDDWEPIEDLDELRSLLGISALAVREATEQAIKDGKSQFGSYDHPVFFLQHMVWHEGYHFSLIMLALRLAGAEPAEEWEDQNVWGLWRDED